MKPFTAREVHISRGAVPVSMTLLFHSSPANLPLLEYQELVLNTLAALNNLSYYAQSDSSIVQRQKEVAECKEGCIYHLMHNKLMAYSYALA